VHDVVTGRAPVPSSWLFVRLAAQSLGRRPLRAFFLALTVAIGVGAVFATAIVRRAVHDSMALGIARMGADLLVVPRETLVNVTPALLVAEPTPHTLDARLAEEVARLPGVDAVAPQRVWTFADATGSQVPDVIAFDPARDFTVLPWLREHLDRPLGAGDAIVGARRGERVGAPIQLGERTLTVRGRLEVTGVGPLDRGVLVSFETVEALASAARGASPPAIFAGARGHVSALLVRLAPGASPEGVRFALASRPAIKVVAGVSLATSIRRMLTALLAGAGVLMLLVLAATILMVGLLYSAVLVERRRELGVLLVLGARRRQLVRLIVAEAVLVTGAGGVVGVVLGASALLALQRSLGYRLASLDVPFVWPAAPALLLHGLVGVGLASCVGLAGALVPAWRLSRREPYELVRAEAS
jgi:putative ABC transport system permease protein